MVSTMCPATVPAVVASGSAFSSRQRTQSHRIAASAQGSRRDVSGLGSALPAGVSLAASRANRAASRRSSAVVLAAAAGASSGSAASTFVQILRMEDLPKGTRKIVSVSGRQAMLFYYRDQLYAIEARSPAEGAYSEGFKDARFTQDGCIICPSTQSTFDIKTGEIREWYPDNTVLRMVTPKDTCRPMEVYPVKVDEGIISIDIGNTNLGSTTAEELAKYSGATTRGGANTSLENNNVYGIEPRMYLETGEEINDKTGKAKIAPATIIIGTVAVAIIAIAGTAFALSKESIPGVIAVWVGLFAPVAYFVVKFGDEGDDPPPKA